MGYETWFRGEGAGVPPARPGGHLQDFGDGMYLTDSVEVAKIYAQRRAPRVEDQRVWMATLERKSLGIVLDLTLDSRWSRFMNEPLHKGASRLHFLKIKHELYNQFFREFVSVNKIKSIHLMPSSDRSTTLVVSSFAYFTRTGRHRSSTYACASCFAL